MVVFANDCLTLNNFLYEVNLMANYACLASCINYKWPNISLLIITTEIIKQIL